MYLTALFNTKKPRLHLNENHKVANILPFAEPCKIGKNSNSNRCN